MVRDTKTKPEPKEIVTDVKLVRQRRRVDHVVLTDFRIKIKARLERQKRYENPSLAAKGALAPRLQRHTNCKIQNGLQGGPKWSTGSGKVSTSRFLGVLSNFC